MVECLSCVVRERRAAKVHFNGGDLAVRPQVSEGSELEAVQQPVCARVSRQQAQQ